MPTAPVAPTTARVGLAVGSSSGPSVDDGLDLVGVEVERRVHGAAPPRRRRSSRTTTEIRISEVEIISMLTPGVGERGEERRAETPGCERMPAPTSETLPIWSSYSSDSKPTLVLDPASARPSPVGPSVLGSVKEMSVRPVAAAETFCTIMSMLISASAQRLEDRGRLAGLVGHADDGDLGLAAVVRDAGDDRLLHRAGPPSVVRVDDPGALAGARTTTARGSACRTGGRTRRSAGAGPSRRRPPSPASPRRRSGRSCGRSGTMRGSAVKTPSTSV